MFQARVEDDFYIYEAYPYYQSNIDNHLKIRFKKFQHNLIMRDRKAGKTKKRGEEDGKEDVLKEGRCNKLRYFDDVAGYSGVCNIFFLEHGTCIYHITSLNFYPQHCKERG